MSEAGKQVRVRNFKEDLTGDDESSDRSGMIRS